jgi:hypothetical protein
VSASAEITRTPIRAAAAAAAAVIPTASRFRLGDVRPVEVEVVDVVVEVVMLAADRVQLNGHPASPLTCGFRSLSSL